jgi:hypothetical protein
MMQHKPVAKPMKMSRFNPMKRLNAVLLVLGLSTLACLAQTNSVSSQADSILSQAVSWNDKLLGLPSGVLTLIVMFLFDSILYYAEFFKNRNIPVFSIVVGATIYFFMSWKVGAGGLPVQIWMTKNIVVGCIVGCVAWIASLRYGQTIIGKFAGKADPSPPLNGDSKSAQPPTP